MLRKKLGTKMKLEALEDFQHALKVFPPGEYYKTYGKTDYYVETLKFIG